jgi:hypothetical protein
VTNVDKCFFALILFLMAISAPTNHEQNAIDEAYDRALQVLYRQVYDTLVTNPPGDETSAATRFKRGVESARHARDIALKNLN